MLLYQHLSGCSSSRWFQYGVAGAAIATVVSQAVSAVLVIWALLKSTDMYCLHPKEIRFHKFLLVSIITIGLPAGIQSVMYNLANMIIQTSLNDLGTSTMAAYTAFGKIDAIFLNAGIMPSSPLSALHVEEWENMVDINLKGVLNGLAAVLPEFTAQKSGHVITTSSVAGLKAYPNGGVYGATKLGGS